MARLLLLRHGQSEWNAQGRWQGQADPPLTEHGADQARLAGNWLVGHGFTGVVTSPLHRARHTAELIAEVLGLPTPEIERDLVERDVGDWSGLTVEQINERWPGLLDRWRHGKLAERPPNGEYEVDFRRRVMGAIHRLVDRPDDQVLLVVTHGGVIHAVGEALESTWRGIRNLHGAWVEHGPAAGLQVRPPEGDEMHAAETVVL